MRKDKVTITIIDYGAGNLRSVAKAFDSLGYRPHITSKAEDVLGADILVLPGVGAASDTLNGLRARGLVEPLKGYMAQGRPFFGVCMGLQVLFDSSEEGEVECLGLIPGRVKKLPPDLKVPHMGWNEVRQRKTSPLFEDMPDNAYFYFVHSYYGDPADKSLMAASTEYGVDFCSVFIKDNLVATQFHPEKSGDMGLKLYNNFVKHWG